MASETLKMNFDRAVEKVSASSLQVSDVKKLKMYALYKQATKGDAPIKGPWAIQILEHAKWNAWNALRSKTNESAMSEYIAEVSNIFTDP